MAAAPSLSVVIPAYNAERTLPSVLAALRAQNPPIDEVIVVDNGSTDATAAIARRLGARLLQVEPPGQVGRARNRGWEAAAGAVVVFLDADAVVDPGWSAGLRRALAEFPGAIIGCARTLVGRNAWSWVAQLQVGTPWLPQGRPRPVRALPSFCVAVPRCVPLRWDETFGGEDGLFAADALQAGLQLVFDPRFHAVHDEYRETLADLRRWHRRFAYGMARCGPVQREGLHKRVLSRLPLHYFALVRLPIMYRRVRHDPGLRSRFLRLLPYLVIAEWMLGLSALRFALRRPPLRSATGA